MSVHRFDVIFQSTTNLPEDNMVNTWHFNGDPTFPATDFDNVRDMLKDFYTAIPGTTGASTRISQYMPSSLINATALVKAYDLADPVPRVPVYESSFALVSLTSSAPLPAEVALCISFQGEAESGTNPARRRNRKYLGPWASTVSGNDGRPTPTLRAVIAGAGRRLKEAADASVTWEWCWYSPTDSANGVVDNGWVDNAWDTQRRRGPAPTTRSTFTDSTPA